jgi:DNA-binding CsgD family transcriptional regulator
MGDQIQEHCPEHAVFTETSSAPDEIVTVQLLIALRPHPDIVVRYIHFGHASVTPCNVLALAAGPLDSIDQLETSGTQPMPLTSREMQLALDLAAGRKLQEIARDHNFSIHTLRNQIKSAMRSTGTRSQTQLVSVVRDWLL